MGRKFELGSLVATKGVADEVDKSKEFKMFVLYSLKRFIECDWGDLCKTDCELNNYAIEKDGRILASYNDPTEIDRKVWIITEADRSVTTILFPHEY